MTNDFCALNGHIWWEVGGDIRCQLCDCRAKRQFTVVGMYEGEPVFAHVEAEPGDDTEIWNLAVQASWFSKENPPPFDAQTDAAGPFDTYTGECIAVFAGHIQRIEEGK